MDIKGKRLLVLGSAGGLDLIERFRSDTGICLITTCDPDYRDSPLCKLADECYDVSPFDYDGLVHLVKSKEIDGIFPGGNEIIIDIVIKVCETCDLPTFISSEQFKLNRDKIYFKDKCREYGIGTPLNYEIDPENVDESINKIKFPVIVKPVDCAGGVGISICSNKDELLEKYKAAQATSPTNHALIEEYLIGREISAVYTLQDGNISLSLFREKYLSEDHPFISAQFDFFLSPTPYCKEFMVSANKKIITMLQSLGFNNGTLFFQGVAIGNEFKFFECGCRIGGGADFRLIEKANGINFYIMMLYFSLTGRMLGYDLSRDTPFFPTYNSSLYIYAHEGEIGRMEGLEEVQKVDGVTWAEYKKNVGDYIEETGSQKQEVFRAYLSSTQIEQTITAIKEIQHHVKITDIEGNNMLYKPFDINRILNR